MAEAKLKIAVFIDFDNIEIGVKTTLGTHFDAGAVLEAIKERGDIVTKIAYGDWTRAGDYSRSLTQHAIHMVQRNLTPGGDKNGADINLALDALEMAFTHSHINSFVIVSGDSDFMALVEKLKQYDRKVMVVGGRAFTSHILQKNCHEFIAYENLIGRRPGARGRAAQEAPLSGAVTLVRRALKVLADREVSPQLGVLKSTLLQLDPTFSEREYGVSTFRDLVQRLARAGYVVLKGTDRNIYVELKEGSDGAPLPTRETDGGAMELAESGPIADAETTQAQAASFSPEPVPPVGIEGAEPVAQSAAPAPAETSAQQAEGLAFIQEVFERPGSVARWPLYLRQVKQLLRAADETFDERRFGFAGLVDALRFCQREGLFRLDRDRQGVLRVYPGTKLQRSMPAPDASTGERTERDETQPSASGEQPVAGELFAASDPASQPEDEHAQPKLESADAGMTEEEIDAAAARAAHALEPEVGVRPSSRRRPVKKTTPGPRRAGANTPKPRGKAAAPPAARARRPRTK